MKTRVRTVGIMIAPKSLAVESIAALTVQGPDGLLWKGDALEI